MKFSIICPTWNRENIIPLAIQSVIDQTYSDWELIIIDDGSPDNTQEVLKKYTDPRIKVITHDICRERIISWNDGMRAATGDWICFLDSDDEVIFGYLEQLKHCIEAFPDYSIFHYGHILAYLGGSTVKEAKDIDESPDGLGMAYFDCGMVGAGSFCFKKELLNEKAYLPEIDDVYAFADWFGERVKEYWAERNLPGEYPRYNKEDKFVGNPWGQDHALFWLLTRENKSKKLPLLPYIAYVRTENWAYEYAKVGGISGEYFG
jgi:glycosyltransferase involved in cell wall biosynthesis